MRICFVPHRAGMEEPSVSYARRSNAFSYKVWTAGSFFLVIMDFRQNWKS